MLMEDKVAKTPSKPQAGKGKTETVEDTAVKPAAARTAGAKAKTAAAEKTKSTDAKAAASGKPAGRGAKPAAGSKPADASANAASATAKPRAASAAKPQTAEPAPAAPPASPDLTAASDRTASSSAAKPKTAAKAKPAQSTASAEAGKAPAAKARSAGAGKASSAADKTKPAAAVEPKAPAARAGRKSLVAAAAKPWLASYPEGVPAEIGALPAESIGDLLAKACAMYRTRPAFTCMGKTMTYEQVEDMSKHLAAYFQSKGLAKGARIAIMMPNVLQYPVTIMAALRAGYTVVNVNPLYTPREMEHQLKDSGAEAIVILENFAKTLQAVIGRTSVKHVVVAAMGDLLGIKGAIVNLVVRRVKKMVPAWSLPGHVKFNDAVKTGRGKALKPVKVAADDVAFLQYTGGTTGVSKGATLLHRNVLANVAQNALWVEAAYRKKPKPEIPIYICALPLYHIYALTVNALMGMQQGAHNILIPNPRDIPGFVKELGKYQVNVFPGLNTLFNALLNNEDFQKLDFKPLLLTFGGGMAVQKGVAERWHKLTGTIISEGYGLSETAPVATANRFDADSFSGTIGMPIPSTEIVIRDDDGKDLPLGEVGEICIRGPQVMAGYWNRPDETAKVMSEDGFFKSGDMGFMDEKGYVKIVDRKKDMIIVSGFNVYPNEIEEVVAQHPGVLEVAAIGVPDEKSGEAPKIFVVKKDPNLTGEALIKHCKGNLTAYKCPKHVEFRADLPKTNVGKILRRELRG
jgi:long-chain acyl-CoA synthetase